MKKQLTAIFAAALVLSTGCGATGTDNNEADAAESVITAVQEANGTLVYENLNNIKAETIYDIITSSESDWRTSNTIGATLIDLDFNGTPEFLVTDLTASENGQETAPQYSTVKIYNFSEENSKLNFIDTLKASSGEISLYTHEDKPVGWEWCNIEKDTELNNYTMEYLLFNISDNKLIYSEPEFSEKICLSKNGGKAYEFYNKDELVATQFLDKDGFLSKKIMSQDDSDTMPSAYYEWLTKVSRWQKAIENNTYSLIPNEKWQPDESSQEDLSNLINNYYSGNCSLYGSNMC